jgi:hypothetical protein
MSSREALTLGTDSRPPVLFRGSYPQWKKRFLDWIERQDCGDEIKDSYENGPVVHRNPVTNEIIPKESWSTAQKNRSKGDTLSRSYLYQALTDDMFCNVDSYETGKEIWDEVERQMERSAMSSTIRLSNVLH